MARRETRIPKGLVPHRRSGIHRGFSYIAHNRRNVRFNGLRRVHTPPQPLTAHTAAHRAKQGRFGWGRYHYPRSVLRGSETLRGRVSERQTLPLLGLGRGCSQRTQRAFGTAMRLCASLSQGVAAPLGCSAAVSRVALTISAVCHPRTDVQRKNYRLPHASGCLTSLACTLLRVADLSNAQSCRS